MADDSSTKQTKGLNTFDARLSIIDARLSIIDAGEIEGKGWSCWSILSQFNLM